MERAISIIKAGGLVGLPTETVYGLAGDATNPESIRKIYELKGRPSNNPLIIHVANLDQAKEIAEFDDRALKLAGEFWPGPLTILLRRKSNSSICKEAYAGLNTIAIRIPSHEIAKTFLVDVGLPIAAPSANISNYISPTELSHVEDAFEDLYILDGGKSVYGLESTIIDLSKDNPTILRHGFITKEGLSKVLGTEVLDNISKDILAPGMMKKHYSPKTPIRINADSLNSGELGLGFGNISLGELNLSDKGDLIEAAANLYSMMRILDKKASMLGSSYIAIAPVPLFGIGIAINDKLKRAIGN